MYISDNITRIFFYESYDNIAIVIMESQMKAIWLDVVLNEVVPQVSAKKFFLLKFIYSEKATKFCEISTNYLTYVLPVK